MQNDKPEETPEERPEKEPKKKPDPDKRGPGKYEPPEEEEEPE